MPNEKFHKLVNYFERPGKSLVSTLGNKGEYHE